MKRRALIAVVVRVAVVAAACGSSGGQTLGRRKTPSKTVVLMTLRQLRGVARRCSPAFTARDRVQGEGAADRATPGKLVSTAIVVKDHPVADALFGIDNTFLTRALDDEPVRRRTPPKGLSTVPEQFQLDPDAPRDADRQRRGVRQRRPRVVRPRRPSARADVARRSREARVPQAARGREPGDVVARASRSC